jgi:hypothetical protein
LIEDGPTQRKETHGERRREVTSLTRRAMPDEPAALGMLLSEDPRLEADETPRRV